MTIQVCFRPSWIDAKWFEDALVSAGDCLSTPDMSVRFVFPKVSG